MTATRRVAVLGGTFDPIHVAHISVLEQVVGLLGAAEGRIVPLDVPPHRHPPMADAGLRLEMARAAVDGHPGLTVDDLEIARGGSSYTVDSVTQWRAADPDAELHVVLGADAARLMPQWHRAADLLGMCHFVVINRSGVARVDVAEARALGFPQDRTRLLNVVSPPVSATEIRRRLAAGESVAELIAPQVAAIIDRVAAYERGNNPDPVR